MNEIRHDMVRAVSADEQRPMAVCSVLTSLTSGGAENLVVNLGNEFAAKGCRHTIISLCDAATLGNSAETEADLRQTILDGGGDFHSLGLTRKRGIFEGARALRRIGRQLRPDVWHFHTARAVNMALVARLPQPAVMTHHNSKLTFPPIMFKLFDRVVSRYVAISPETSALFDRFSRRPHSEIPNAAGAAFNMPAGRTSISARARILSVGAISDQKNYDLLIDTAYALKEMLGNRAMPVFSIAGGGADLGKLRARVDQLGLGDAVQFLGERSDVHALLAQSDIFLNTSRYEGMAISIIEAMSMALPVVATPVPGNTAMVKDEVTGHLAADESGPALADALLALLDDANLYQRLSQGALDDSRRFSIDTCAQSHLDLYGSLLQPERIAPLPRM